MSLKQSETKKPVIYFVCAANICRSRMMEAFFNAKLGDKYEFRSAGADVEKSDGTPIQDSKPLSQAINALKKVGIEIDYTQDAKQITKSMVDEADLVICVSESKTDKVKKISGKSNEHKVCNLTRIIPDPFDGQSFLPNEIEEITQIDPKLEKSTKGISKSDAAYQFLTKLIAGEFFTEVSGKLENLDLLNPAILQKSQEDLDFEGQINKAIDEFDLEFLASVPSEKEGKMNEIIAERFKQDLKHYLRRYSTKSQNDPNYGSFVEQIISDTAGAIEYSIASMPNKPLKMLFGMMRMREYLRLSEQGLDIFNHNQLPIDLVRSLTTSYADRKNYHWLGLFKCRQQIDKMIDELFLLRPLLAHSQLDLQEHRTLTNTIITPESSILNLRKNTQAFESFKLIKRKYFDLEADEIEQLRMLLKGTQKQDGWENISKKVLYILYYNHELYQKLSFSDFLKLARLVEPKTTEKEHKERWEFFVKGNLDQVQEGNIAHLLIFTINQNNLAKSKQLAEKLSEGSLDQVQEENVVHILIFAINQNNLAKAKQLAEKLLGMNLNKVLEIFNSRNDKEQEAIKDYFAEFLIGRLESNNFGNQEVRIVELGLVNLKYQIKNGENFLDFLAKTNTDPLKLKPFIESGLLDVNQLYGKSQKFSETKFLTNALLFARDKEKDAFKEVVKVLFDNEGDFNRPQDNITPLIRFLHLYLLEGRANYIDHLEKALIFIEKGADPYIKFRNHWGKESTLIKEAPKDRSAIIDAYTKFLKNQDLVAKRVGFLLLYIKLKNVRINFSIERLNQIFDKFQKGSKLEYVDAIWMLNELSGKRHELNATNTDIKSLRDAFVTVTEESFKDKPFANIARPEPETQQIIDSKSNTTIPTQSRTLPPTPLQIDFSNSTYNSSEQAKIGDDVGRNAGSPSPTPTLSGAVDAFYYIALVARWVTNGRLFPDLQLPRVGNIGENGPGEVTPPSFPSPDENLRNIRVVTSYDPNTKTPSPTVKTTRNNLENNHGHEL